MKTSRISPRIAGIAVILALSLALLTVIGWSLREREAQGAEAELFVLSAQSSSSSFAPGLADAREVNSVASLKLQVAGPAVIVVDRSAVPGLVSGSLNEFAEKGYALVGLNVPIDQLSDLAGFSAEVAEIDPRFGEKELTPVQFKGDFFTVVWRTPDGAQTERWSRGQQDFSPQLFDAVVADLKLRSAGLARDNSGNLIPLEEY